MDLVIVRKTDDYQFPAAKLIEKMGRVESVQESIALLVAIPAYNEEVAIGSVVARAKVYADKVIVVDDGSKDKTAEVARLVGAEVITHAKNGGYGAAIRTCFNTAKKYNADVMVILDADGQHSPSDIPLLMEEMKNSGADIVIGSRFLNGNSAKGNIPAYRKVGMKVLDMATAMSSGLNVTDTQSGFRAYSRNAIRNIKLGDMGMGAGSEILMKAADVNLKISEAPITVRYDIKGTSSIGPIEHGLSVLNSIIKLTSQKRPLLFFCTPGSVLLAFGMLLLFIVLTIFNATHNVAIGYTMLGLLCAMLGTFSLFTGLTLYSIQSLKPNFS